MSALRTWFDNPWGRPRWLRLATVLYLVWSIVPLLIAIRFSFNEGRSRSTAQGWSTQWYVGNPGSVWDDPDLRGALRQSLLLAFIAVVVTVPLGAALALGITRWRSRASGTARTASLVPIITPEIVMGVALFLVFTQLFTSISLGTLAQAIGHVTFSITFVMIIVRARLLSIGPEYEQAAQDLGATPLQALRLALVPMLTPALIASAIFVFALSMDDFVVSAYLSSGAGTDTVPVRIYSTARGAPTPALNALASVTLAVTLVIAVIAFAAWQVARRRGGQTGSGIGELSETAL
jgi:spermidine/putrescine transport system permease protein